MAVHRQLLYRILRATSHSLLLSLLLLIINLLSSHTLETIRPCLHLPWDLQQQDKHMLAEPTSEKLRRLLLLAFDHSVAPPMVPGLNYGNRLLAMVWRLEWIDCRLAEIVQRSTLLFLEAVCHPPVHCSKLTQAHLDQCHLLS
jgi:hypothetical protein